MVRVRRGVWRLVHFPAGEHEDLTAVWLWSGQKGVFSHQTALALHALSDVLPARIHLTLPEAWRRRRLRVPEGVVLHYHHGEVGDSARCWFGPVPATAPLRTLEDCAAEHLPPELLRAAALDALSRGLVSRPALGAVEAALAPFGGLAP
jgi:predicted transcriptional regulator of viral defense system